MRAAAEIDGAESLVVGFGVLSVAAAVFGMHAKAAVVAAVTMLFLSWRSSLIKASESLLEIDA